MRYALSHTHAPDDCGVSYAAWRGFDSRLRHEPTLATCAQEGSSGEDHVVLWTVEAASPAEALGLLPQWLAERTEARPVDEVAIP